MSHPVTDAPGPIEEFLGANGGILRGQHFVFTAGGHSDEYFDIRRVVHFASWMDQIGGRLADQLHRFEPDILLGPRTNGQTLVDYTAPYMGESVWAVWCENSSPDDPEAFSFSPKTPQFPGLFPGKRVAIIDDLLTSGKSLKRSADLAVAHGGEVVAAITVVRRNQAVDSVEGIPEVLWLEDIVAQKPLTPEECAASGPCSRRVPMVTRPGHGHEWLAHPENADYPVADPIG